VADEVRVKGLRELVIKLGKVAKALKGNSYLMGQVGAFVQTEILTRTAKGVDADGNPFDPYSPGYLVQRAKEGRPTDVVDLFFTGSMLSALTYDEAPQQVTLFFMDTTDKFGMRNPEKAYYNQQLRDFFAMSAKDVAAVQDMVSKYIAKALKKG